MIPSIRRVPLALKILAAVCAMLVTVALVVIPGGHNQRESVMPMYRNSIHSSIPLSTPSNMLFVDLGQVDGTVFQHRALTSKRSCASKIDPTTLSQLSRTFSIRDDQALEIEIRDVPLPQSNALIIRSTDMHLPISNLHLFQDQLFNSGSTFKWQQDVLSYQDPNKLFSNPRYSVMHHSTSSRCHRLYDIKILLELKQVFANSNHFKIAQTDDGGTQVLLPMHLHYVGALSATELFMASALRMPDLIIDVHVSQHWMISECVSMRESGRGALWCTSTHSPSLVSLDVVPNNNIPLFDPIWYTSFIMRDHNRIRFRITTSIDVPDSLEGKIWISASFREKSTSLQHTFVIGMAYRIPSLITATNSSASPIRAQNGGIEFAKIATNLMKDERAAAADPTRAIRGSDEGKSDVSDAAATTAWQEPRLFFSLKPSSSVFDVDALFSNNIAIDENTAQFHVLGIVNNTGDMLSSAQLRILYLDASTQNFVEVPAEGVSIRQSDVPSHAPSQMRQPGVFLFEVEQRRGALTQLPTQRLVFQLELQPNEEMTQQEMDTPKHVQEQTHRQPTQIISEMVTLRETFHETFSGNSPSINNKGAVLVSVLVSLTFSLLLLLVM